MSTKNSILKNIFIFWTLTCVQPLMTDLVKSNLESNNLSCVRPDIEQFPKTFFDQNDRQNGAVIFYLLVGVYMFIALAIVCDEYFVPSLETICKVFGIKDDIAG